jgi:hypothetical protein
MAGRAIKKLSDLALRAFITRARRGTATKKKLSDGGGMYLMLTPAGTPVWRAKYRFGGREKLYAIGIYPEVSLEAARAKREELKWHPRERRDPIQARDLAHAENVASAGNTFQQVADTWLQYKNAEWSAVHYVKSRRAIARDVLPQLGKLAIAEVMVANVLKGVARRGARDTAAKILWHVTSISKYAQAHGMRHDNPARAGRRGCCPSARAATGYANLNNLISEQQ